MPETKVEDTTVAAIVPALLLGNNLGGEGKGGEGRMSSVRIVFVSQLLRKVPHKERNLIGK